MLNQLDALIGSIRKWEAIVRGTGEDDGGKNCQLCRKFYDTSEAGPCIGCPVREKTGFYGCVNTPYEDWVAHQGEAHAKDAFPHYVVQGCDECKRLATAELDFLKSLVPKKWLLWLLKVIPLRCPGGQAKLLPTKDPDLKRLVGLRVGIDVKRRHDNRLAVWAWSSAHSGWANIAVFDDLKALAEGIEYAIDEAFYPNPLDAHDPTQVAA
jgi:hypothetical protein